MTNRFNDALWQQYGGALGMLDNALAACPDELWTAPLWRVSPESGEAATASEFWSLAAHTLRWLERYLAAAPEHRFAALECSAALTPAAGARLDRTAVRGALATLRQRCHDVLTALGDADLQRPVTYDWIAAEPITYAELQVYGLRHLQEHAAQLNLFLGQHGVPDEALDWVSRADP
ncbi:MAG TPA: DinB family protein [Candidatus Dormibacteraeota bacterium]|nr:DinB family protein [Candidatus Dormibacteraeota bacterium]